MEIEVKHPTELRRMAGMARSTPCETPAFKNAMEQLATHYESFAEAGMAAVFKAGRLVAAIML